MRFYSQNNTSFIKDYGDNQVTLPINNISMMNNNYRASIWTGAYTQVTVMSIPIRDDIGLEQHETYDQLLFITHGRAAVYAGATPETVKFQNYANAGDMITVPAGTWHNITNAGNVPLKLFSVYAPPKHPFGTLQKTKQDAQNEET